MNKKLTSLLLSLSTSLFLTSCSHKPKQLQRPPTQQTQQLLTSPPSQQTKTIYELKYPATQPSPKPQSQPYQPPIDFITTPPQFPTSSQLSQLPQSQPTQSSKPTNPQPNLEQICAVINTELSSLTREYVNGLRQHQDAHDKRMREKPEEVYENYLSLEIGALNIALDTIKNPRNSQYREKNLEQIARQYLQRSQELNPEIPINYTSTRLVKAYTGLLKLREASIRDTLKRAAQKQKSYTSYQELLRDIFTEEKYESLMKQHVEAVEIIEKAFLKSRTGIKANIPYFGKKIAEEELSRAAAFTSKFYLGTTQRYYGDK